jgi:hypothetical protein
MIRGVVVDARGRLVPMPVLLVQGRTETMMGKETDIETEIVIEIETAMGTATEVTNRRGMKTDADHIPQHGQDQDRDRDHHDADVRHAQYHVHHHRVKEEWWKISEMMPKERGGISYPILLTLPSPGF